MNDYPRQAKRVIPPALYRDLHWMLVTMMPYAGQRARVKIGVNAEIYEGFNGEYIWTN